MDALEDEQARPAFRIAATASGMAGVAHLLGSLADCPSWVTLAVDLLASTARSPAPLASASSDDCTLASSEWIRQHQNVLLIGPTGIGKSWLACALAQKACRDSFSVLHKRTSELFRELAGAHADGSIGRAADDLQALRGADIDARDAQSIGVRMRRE